MSFEQNVPSFAEECRRQSLVVAAGEWLTAIWKDF